MDILYKTIGGSDEFKKIDNNIIDLNACILKFVDEDIITEVEIEDEIIKNHQESNEFIYHKLKTTAGDKLRIKVKIKKDNKIKNIEKTIKIDKNSYIYDKNELASIRKIGEFALASLKDNIANTNNDYFETILNNIQGDLDNIDEVYKSFANIIKLAKEISINPKVELVEKETVKDSNMVKKINSSSARYFTMHPEYWYREGDELPRPIKILTESFEENRDIYENQLIKYILYKCKDINEKIIYSLEAIISALEGSIIKAQANIDTEEMSQSEINKVLIENKVKKDKLKIYKSYRGKFKISKGEIKELLYELSDIKLNTRIKLRLTQKILYDKRYFKILNIYNKNLKELKFNTEEKSNCDYPAIYSFMFIFAEIVCQSLQSLGFCEIENEIKAADKTIFDSNDMIDIYGYHFNHSEDNKFYYKMTINSLNSESKNSILLELNYREEKEKIRFYFNPIFTQKPIGVIYVNDLYKKYYDESYDTTIIINTLSIDRIKFTSENEKQKSIFNLSTLGNSFSSYEDYKKYGAFKQGMISLSSRDLGNEFYKLINLFRLKMIKLHCYEYCTYCGHGPYIQQEKELLICSACGKKIAINKCNSCGNEMIKFLSKVTSEDIEEKFEDAINYHKKYEIKIATLGACYEKFYSNSGGFCSSCGKCQKENGNCTRCNVIN